CPHQEYPAQAGADSGRAALRSDGLRRGLPLCRAGDAVTPHRDPGPPPSGSGPAPGDRETPERPRPWTDPASGLPRRPGARRGPPPWWPEGEPWPPPRGKGGHNRGRFIRRIVFALGAIWLFTLFMGFIFGRFAPQE